MEAPARKFGYRRHPDQDQGHARHPLVIVGAGPVGLTLALLLARANHPVVLLDDADRIGDGSRAICFSKRSLELWDRLDICAPMLAKGVQWQTGKIFLGPNVLHQFHLLPEPGHKMPAFINIQQYYVESFLVDGVNRSDKICMRWSNKVIGLHQHNDHAELDIETPDGNYTIAADHVIACDGARSALRRLVSADFIGETFEDQFLIADVKMTAEFPTERWFWFDPPFHTGRSALLHRQPDDIWRIDLQLGPDADASEERKPENVRPRITRMLGHDDFTFEWISVYKFQCRRMERFVHGRVIFAGDAAHQVSPFGARGANSGLEDAENLAWKLDHMLRSLAGTDLLQSYDTERGQAANENLRASTWATDFIAPATAHELRMRRAVLNLAREAEFATRMINGGRLSVPSVYQSPLNTADVDAWLGGPAPGTHLFDAPLAHEDGRTLFLSDAFRQSGCGFTLLHTAQDPIACDSAIAQIQISETSTYRDRDGLFHQRYDMQPGSCYLLRPDGYVAARFRQADISAIDAAFNRARGKT